MRRRRVGLREDTDGGEEVRGEGVLLSLLRRVLPHAVLACEAGDEGFDEAKRTGVLPGGTEGGDGRGAHEAGHFARRLVGG